MRILALVSLAVTILACQGQVCSAESTPPHKTATAPDVGRIGTLSPDEARRAARARKRAAMATKISPTAHVEAKRVTETPALKSRVRTSMMHAPGAASGANRPRIAQDYPLPSPTLASHRPARIAKADRWRMVSRPEVRRTWRSAGAGRTRYALAPRYMRGPRVGEAIRPGVPLYALPPRYTYGAVIVPPQPYVVYEPAYPPYPGPVYRYDSE